MVHTSKIPSTLLYTSFLVEAHVSHTHQCTFEIAEAAYYLFQATFDRHVGFTQSGGWWHTVINIELSYCQYWALYSFELASICTLLFKSGGSRVEKKPSTLSLTLTYTSVFKRTSGSSVLSISGYAE